MTADCNREIEEAEKEIAELEQTAAEGDAFKQKIDEIRRVLTNAQRDAAQGIITKEFIDKYISKIFVTPKDDTTMLLQVKIFTGETTESTSGNSKAARVTSPVIWLNSQKSQTPQGFSTLTILWVTRLRK